ncbi:hypothetical protein AWB74_07601 [Caballeronia arvi]|uniref:Uncharacterized protein n=1 Tax=Caballeronia arvi TaxID=1777135 RepID=A0A158KYF2_9BURK|nr:hypothetical protein AWB74_07601 [Caballeronia arvi]
MRPKSSEADSVLARALVERLVRCEESLCRQNALVEQLAADKRCDAVHIGTLASIELTYELLFSLWTRASSSAAASNAALSPSLRNR